MKDIYRVKPAKKVYKVKFTRLIEVYGTVYMQEHAVGETIKEALEAFLAHVEQVGWERVEVLAVWYSYEVIDNDPPPLM